MDVRRDLLDMPLVGGPHEEPMGRVDGVITRTHILRLLQMRADLKL